ncbi:FDLD family class I lanthipeptide [Bacillus sp. FJAT-49705]|uniref:FDLD family class I lanthipeptide n=1 Tax=Cytobacillus citreus TaxID=2833586 RepID=A0ABS5NYD0_9BACI|nr:FDLD family class I lanthipeptide [Cytobacillus citreus]MBS4192867.1 FDLD family class I lanthipeptide [Cytobacillus citreus]
MQKDLFNVDFQVQQMNSDVVEPDTVRTTVCWVTKVTCKASCGCNFTSYCTPGCF